MIIHAPILPDIETTARLMLDFESLQKHCDLPPDASEELQFPFPHRVSGMKEDKSLYPDNTRLLGTIAVML